MEAGAGRRQRREGGSALEELLEVVEQEQHVLLVDVVHQTDSCPERVDDLGLDELAARDRRERNPEHAVRKLTDELGRDLEREACLPAAACAGERRDAVSGDERAKLRDLVDPSDQRARLGRQIRRVQRPERREHPGSDLIETLGLRQILEPVQSEVAELDRRLEQPAGLGRQDDLSPVGCGADAGRPVDVEADVALLGEHGLA